MAGGGSIAAMITILRNNRSMLRKSSMFKKERSFLNNKKVYHSNVAKKVFSEKATKKQLHKVRKQLKKSKTQEYRKLLIAFGIVLICFGIFVFWATYSNSDILDYPYPNRDLRSSSPTSLEKYHFFIEDGDRWLKEAHWHNAIFQYQEALKLFPNEYDVNYRLALVYSYQCAAEKQHCFEGINLMHQLSAQYPERIQLQELRAFYLEVFLGTH